MIGFPPEDPEARVVMERALGRKFVPINRDVVQVVATSPETVRGRFDRVLAMVRAVERWEDVEHHQDEINAAIKGMIKTNKRKLKDSKRSVSRRFMNQYDGVFEEIAEKLVRLEKEHDARDST